MNERQLQKVFNGKPGHNIALTIAMLSFLVSYTRPQAVFPILGVIRLPLALSLLSAFCLPFVFFRTTTLQTRLMCIFLGVEAVRCFVGKKLFDDLVRNDYYAANTWVDLFLQFAGMVFPIVAFAASRRGLKKIQRYWFLAVSLLSIYILAHGGVGPKGFLGDENDAGIALLFLLPLPLVTMGELGSGKLGRLVAFGVTLLVLAALVSTFSRGAFVGLVCVITVFIFGTSRKGIATVLLITLIGISTIFVPKSYWNEIGSIGEIRTGTAEQRREMWTVASRVWLDPRHILIGVGMENVKYYLKDYEFGSELGSRPSLGGRAVHSIYFQILPDLGLWGAFIIGLLTWKSYCSLSATRQIVKRLLTSNNLQPKLETELGRLLGWTTALGASMVGLFSAGAFISILYYPHLWLLFGLCAVVERYAKLLQSEVESGILEAGEELSQL